MIPVEEFVTLAVIHFLAIASPGPNVIAAITNAFTHGLRAGVLTSLGIATGNLFHIALGIFGVTVLITYPELSVLISLLASPIWHTWASREFAKVSGKKPIRI